MTTSSMPAISAKSTNASVVSALLKLVWCGPPASSHASAAVARLGLGAQSARATGSRGSSCSGPTTSISFATRRKRVAEIEQPDDDGRPRRRGEDEPHGIVPRPDRERMDLAARLAGADRGADLEHVRAEHLLGPRRQVVRVVLHERRAALEPGAHHLADANERGRLPVALARESVAVCHQALHGEPRQLPEAAEILEGVREGQERAVLEEPAQAGLDPGRVPQRLALRAVLPQRGHELVGLLVLGDQTIDVRVVDRVDRRRQLADAVPVDGDAEANLSLDLVALGDGDLPHVVAEAGEAQRLRLVPPAGRPRPGADPLLDGWVGPVAGDGLPREPQARGHVAELAVAVRRLVQVHEVHVDLGPRQLAVELRVQMEERLLQRAQAGDPHLRGRERVHPGDDPDAAVVPVRLGAERANRLGAPRRRLVDDADRHGLGGVEPCRHLGRVLRDLAQGGLAVHVLAPGHEPDLESVERFHLSPFASGL